MNKMLLSSATALFVATMLAAGPSAAEPMPSTFHGEGRTAWISQHAFADDPRAIVTGSVNHGSRENMASSQLRRPVGDAPIFGRGTGSEDSYGHTYRLGDK